MEKILISNELEEKKRNNRNDRNFNLIIGASFVIGVVAGNYISKFFKSNEKKEQKTISENTLLAGIEGGGTSWKVAIAKGSPTNIIKEKTFLTTTPYQTFGAIVDWLEQQQFDSIGIACFGPVDLNKESPTYGFITSTPKLKWQNTDVLKPFKTLNKPISFDTDVNGPALAELIHGNHKSGTKSLCYVSVGTGAGVGLIIDGNPVHGAMHPEGGHICVKRHPNDSYKGDCEFHQDCLEGMVRISSLAARAGLEDPADLPSLPDEHQVWDFFAYYIAQLCLSLTLTVSPDVIVLGGGVINRESLLPLIRNKFTSLLNRYVQVKTVEDVDNYIIRSKQKQNSGIIGALELSKRALLSESK